MAAVSRFAGSLSAPESVGCRSSLPTLAESLKVLSALVMYLRIWVASWAATQLLATKKMRAKQRISNNTLPRSVTQGGKITRSRRPEGRRGRLPEPLPELIGFRRAFGLDLWDLRSTNTSLPRRSKARLPATQGAAVVGEGGLEPPRPLGH